MAMGLQETLRNLCSKTGWCYAVFWKLKRRSRMVLTWEDGYCEYVASLPISNSASTYMSASSSPFQQLGGNPVVQHVNVHDGALFEDQIKLAVANMSYHVHSLGEGLIGRVAFTGKHLWVYAHQGIDNSAKETRDGHSCNRSILEKYPAGWGNQFNAGIKTIAVVAVPQGVVQLGSTQKMSEDIDFVSHVQALFGTLQNVSRAVPADCSPETESGRSHQGISQAVPIAVLMPMGPLATNRETSTAVNGQPQPGIFCSYPAINLNRIESTDLVNVGLSNMWASPNLQSSQLQKLTYVPSLQEKLEVAEQSHELSDSSIAAGFLGPLVSQDLPSTSAFPSLTNSYQVSNCSKRCKLSLLLAPDTRLTKLSLPEHKSPSDFQNQEQLQTCHQSFPGDSVTTTSLQVTQDQLQDRFGMPKIYQDKTAKELDSTGVDSLQVSPLNLDSWVSMPFHAAAVADEVVPSQIKVSYPSSTKGDANSVSLSTLTGLSCTNRDLSSKCSFSCPISGCKSPPNLRQDWDAPWRVPMVADDVYLAEHMEESVLPDFESVLPISDYLGLGELETWEEDFSARNTRLIYPGNTSLKILSGSNCNHESGANTADDMNGSLAFLSQEPCQYMETSGPQVSRGDELSELLAPLNKKESKRDASQVNRALPSSEGDRDKHISSMEQFTRSSWPKGSLQSFETLSSDDIVDTNIKAEPLLEAVVAGVSNYVQSHSNILDDSSFQDSVSKCECVVPAQPILSVNSCSSDISLSTVAKQSQSKAMQAACKDNESLKRCEIKPTRDKSLGELEWRQTSGESRSKLAYNSCIEEMQIPKYEDSSPRQSEATKGGRKRPRPGEATRPRPKDRQLIQDRLRELREIVPNSTKCSIDALLERTIKHMHFLQSVTQHSEKWKHVSESKKHDIESNSLPQDKLENGASWALELGGPEMGCPVVVENLSQPRQMLVEMLCEQKGLFLEIADNFRAMGLTILKGVVELRNEKTWARFIVEASRDMHRVEILWSVMQLLQSNVKSDSAVATQGSLCRSLGTGSSPFPTFQQSSLPPVHINQMI
ncbi:hypothetical protein O6H91_18G084000 [Diphasiastrum complanatum]|uniref:Uncharacterized protein n=2 Tax=Diphasiastrum complanatum TaxID=34168 RepID=A0ACC2B374_DIPCM|nr:hypothetical protein O6H91_18G084000 [Diphasiastrum complanatum]